MNRNVMTFTAVVVAIALTNGCRSLPGTNEQQGAVIGGAGGAIAGAAIAENNLLGALIGGAAGAAGGYLLGANADKIIGRDKDAAQAAVNNAQREPATASQARNSSSADLNSDGFVTMDEIVALREANLTDEQIILRLRATDQVFDLTPSQENELLTRGISNEVIDAMKEVNREERQRLLRQTDDVIGRPRY